MNVEKIAMIFANLENAWTAISAPSLTLSGKCITDKYWRDLDIYFGK